MAASIERRSDARRTKLKEEEDNLHHIVVSNICPIDRYYNVAERVLTAFEQRYEQCNAISAGASSEGKEVEFDDQVRVLDDAYIYARRYAMFISHVLPNHSYFKSSVPKYVGMRNDALVKLNAVVEKMEIIADIMDLQEHERELMEEQKLKERLRMEEEFKKKQEEDALQEKLRRLMMFDSTDKERKDDEENLPVIPPPSFAEFVQSHDTQPSAPPMADIPQENGQSSVSALNDSLPKPAVSVPLETSLSKSLSDWGLGGEQKPSTSPELPSKRLKINGEEIFVKDLMSRYNTNFAENRSKYLISVFMFNTFQGKYAAVSPERDSTNGCTVIAGMVAANHLTPPYGSPAIPNSKVESIIDIDAPPILRKVRIKLGLDGNALIIPSDVNDYLVEKNLLHQDQFVGVSGGNILDDKHVEELLLLIENGDANENKSPSQKVKVAATFFFHEHVICLLKTYTSKGELRYELVDSLANRRLLQQTGSPMTAGSRIRCVNKESFKSALMWYATAKFSDANCDFIDRYSWDEGNCEFDPRVFQAFVWKEKTD